MVVFAKHFDYLWWTLTKIGLYDFVASDWGSCQINSNRLRTQNFWPTGFCWDNCPTFISDYNNWSRNSVILEGCNSLDKCHNTAEKQFGQSTVIKQNFLIQSHFCFSVPAGPSLRCWTTGTRTSCWSTTAPAAATAQKSTWDAASRNTSRPRICTPVSRETISAWYLLILGGA